MLQDLHIHIHTDPKGLEMKVSELIEILAATNADLIATDTQLLKAKDEIIAKVGELQASVQTLTASVADLTSRLSDATLTEAQAASVQAVVDGAAKVKGDAQALDDLNPDAPAQAEAPAAQ